MKLLSKPKELSYKNPRRYDTFYFFQLALTERNWTGNDYIVKKDCSWFIEELKELDEVFYKLFGNILGKSRFTFLMDISIFSEEIPESYKLNYKIIDFLEELDDFSELDSSDNEQIKKSKKYLAKLKNFATKMENLPYIYRWSSQNEHHPFSAEIKVLVDNEVARIGNKARKDWINDVKKIDSTQKKLIRKGILDRKAEEKLDELQVQMVYNCEVRDKKFVSQILKYSLSEPSLFFYGIYFIVQYYKKMEDLMPPGFGYEFISFERDGNKIDVFLKDSTQLLNNNFLLHEPFISTLPKVKRRTDGRVASYETLYDVKGQNFDNEEQVKSVLRTISNWIIERIPSDAKFTFPTKKWLHPVKNKLFNSLGISSMFFEDISFIGGPDEKELLIKTHAFMGETNEVLFPLFNPDSWDELNAFQCALITYALCLLHDVTIEKDYELFSQPTTTPRGEVFDYLLVTKEGTGTVTPLQLKRTNKETDVDKEKEVVHTEEYKKSEHWVSFHFRRLKQGYKASDKQKVVAAKYGFKNLPDGFTFVDSFVRGEKKQEDDRLHFSALDVLNKTLSKLDTYKELENIK